MHYAEMIELLEFYVDDTVDSPIARRLFNEGKNRMAAAVHSSFPDIQETSDAGDSFVFDERFHELPVLYAAAMVKAYDSSIREKDAFMADFEHRLKDFVMNYDPPVQYLNGDHIQHFTVTEASDKQQFSITEPSYNTYSRVYVYVNSQSVPYRYDGNEIFLDTPAPVGSIVTVQWTPDLYSNAASWVKAW